MPISTVRTCGLHGRIRQLANSDESTAPVWLHVHAVIDVPRPVGACSLQNRALLPMGPRSVGVLDASKVNALTTVTTKELDQ